MFGPGLECRKNTSRVHFGAEKEILSLKCILHCGLLLPATTENVQSGHYLDTMYSLAAFCTWIHSKLYSRVLT